MNGKTLSKCSIKIPSRIHITLIGMNDSGYRINGGIGFCINEPFIKLKIEKNKELIVKDLRNFPLSKSEIKRIEVILNKAISGYNLKHKVKIQIYGNAPTHYGFGTSTSTRLGCLEGLFIINHKKINFKDLQFLSGRGGTSGIGINSYFKGGFFFDLGRKRINNIFKPSSESERRDILPLVLTRIKMPNWQFGICLPSFIKPKSEEEEKLFFKGTCPIKNEETYKILYHSLYGVTSSILENDIENFSKSINELQMCTWKKLEKKLYSKDLPKIENILFQNGANTVGMSSLGPSLFFLIPNLEDKIFYLKKYLRDCELILTKPNNSGRKVIHD